MSFFEEFKKIKISTPNEKLLFTGLSLCWELIDLQQKDIEFLRTALYTNEKVGEVRSLLNKEN
jgi:hypothetical protein